MVQFRNWLSGVWSNCRALLISILLLTASFAVGILLKPQNKDWVDILGSLGPVCPSIMVAYIAWQQWNTAEKIRKRARAKIYFENYRRIAKGLGAIMQEAKISGETLEHFWVSRDEARIHLCKEIADYTEGLRKQVHELTVLEYVLKDEFLEKKERKKQVDKKYDIIAKLLEEKPHEKYRKYIAEDN